MGGDLKLKIIGYDVKMRASEVEKVVNHFMAQVNVVDVQVVVAFSSIVIHVFYNGEAVTEYEQKAD